MSVFTSHRTYFCNGIFELAELCHRFTRGLLRMHLFVNLLQLLRKIFQFAHGGRHSLWKVRMDVSNKNVALLTQFTYAGSLEIRTHIILYKHALMLYSEQTTKRNIHNLSFMLVLFDNQSTEKWQPLNYRFNTLIHPDKSWQSTECSYVLTFEAKFCSCSLDSCSSNCVFSCWYSSFFWKWAVWLCMDSSTRSCKVWSPPFSSSNIVSTSRSIP